MRFITIALLATTAYVLVPAAAREDSKAPQPAAESALAPAVRTWLASLDEKRRATASFDFDSPERKDWHFIPRERHGLSLKEMSEGERKATDTLLDAMLPEKGRDAVNRIMALEDVLHEIEQSDIRDALRYYVSVFGSKDSGKRFGVRYEGHHVAINLTSVAGKTSFTPFFLGTNPAEVKSGPKKGERVLGEISDRGLQILKSLNVDQMKAARIADTVPAELKFVPGTTIDADLPGLHLDLVNPGQFILIHALLQYVGDLAIADSLAPTSPKFDPRMDRSSLAFAGSLEPGAPLYFRFTLDDIVLEYVNIQNGANHVHFLMRSKSDDFGAKLLADHLKGER